MLPTINNGDNLQTIKLNAESRAQLVRGDIIAFRYPKDPSKGYVKRLIGLPGDTVEIKKGEVWVNGTRLLEPYVDPKLNVSQRSLRPVNIPQQAYYVLGDNRDNSNDSRIWGSVPAELVYAKTVRHQL